jgi:geranylgeranyl pyrophosphate synthase
MSNDNMSPALIEYCEEVLPSIEKGIKSFLKVLDRPEEIAKRRKNIGKQDTDTYLRSVREPVNYTFLEIGGKRLRPLILRLSHDIARGDLPLYYKNIDGYAAIFGEVPHRATVISDDIDDNTHLRNGIPTTHVKFGRRIAGNAGNFLYFASELCLDFPDLFFPNGNGQKIGESRELAIRQALSQELRIAHIGQAMDLTWAQGRRLRKINNLPTEDQFYEMCANKSTFPLAMRIGAILGGAPENQYQQRGIYGYIGAGAGIAFQLRDDMLELSPEHPDFGEDFIEGNPRLAEITTLRGKEPYSSSLRNLFISEINDDEEGRRMASEATEIMKDAGAISYVNEKAIEYGDKAIRDLRRLSPRKTRARQVMEELIEFGYTRNR